MATPETVFEMPFAVFPEDTNYMPPMIFGGKLLAEMDICAAMTVRRFLYYSQTSKDAVTVGVTNVSFFIGAVVSDLIFLRGEIVRTGHSSIDVHVTGWREQHVEVGANGQAAFFGPPKREKICDGDFRFCSCTPPKFGKVNRWPHGLHVEPKQDDVFKKIAEVPHED